MRRGDAVLKHWRKFETCHINFSHCSYQGVWVTTENLGEYGGKKQQRRGEKKRERWKAGIREKEKVAADRKRRQMTGN